MAETTRREDSLAAGPSLLEHTLDESDGNIEKQARKKESYDEESESEYEVIHNLGEHDILEVKIGQQEHTPKKPRMDEDLEGARCEGRDCMSITDGNLAHCIHYESNMYICVQCICSYVSEDQELVSLESEPSERVGMADKFVGRMRNERTRESEFDKEDIRMYGNVNAKHDLDDYKRCEVTGLCGLGDKKFGVVDRRNSCMKIYSAVTTKLLRYIRFGSSPYDATEVKVPHSFTQTQHEIIKTVNGTEMYVQGFDVESGHGNDISETSKVGTETLIAVTIPTLNELWFIDTNKEPASIAMKLGLDLACESIDFYEGMIFVLLREDFSSEIDSLYSILVLSPDGQKIKVIKDDMFTDIHDMVVNNGVIYLTDFKSDVIFGVNVEGSNVRKRMPVHVSSPRGICADPENNILFVCSYNDSTVYISSDGEEFRPLPLDKRLRRHPWSVCFSDGKLFIGNYWLDTGRNFIDIIQFS